MFRILQMFENVRGPITGQVLTCACGKMPGCFADMTGITAHTCKLKNNMRTEPVRDRVFHAKVKFIIILKEEKTSLISKSLQ